MVIKNLPVPASNRLALDVIVANTFYSNQPLFETTLCVYEYHYSK